MKLLPPVLGLILLLSTSWTAEALNVTLGKGGARTLFPGEYEWITRDDGSELFRLLADSGPIPEEVRQLLSPSSRIYRRSLQCYPMDFYLIEYRGSDYVYQAGLLISRNDPREVHYLDGNPTLYYKLNDRGLLTITSREQAEEYVRLLLNTIGSRTSTLHLIEEWDDLYWITPSNPDYGQQVIPEKEIRSRLAPLQLQASDPAGSWLATAHITYADAFYKVTLQINANGDFRFLQLEQDLTQKVFFHLNRYEGHLCVFVPRISARETYSNPKLAAKLVEPAVNEELRDQLLAVWEQFPLLEINREADEPAKWYEAVSHLRSIRVGKHDLSGFRFRYEPKEPLDFVWGWFTGDGARYGNLVAKEGSFLTFTRDSKVPQVEIDQSETSSISSTALTRERLVPGQEYLLWFKPLSYKPRIFRFTIALRNLKPNPPEIPTVRRFDLRSVVEGMGLDFLGELGVLTDTGGETGLVLAVGPTSPALQGGLRPGDRILRIDPSVEPKKARQARIKAFSEQRFQDQLKQLRKEGRTEPDDELIDIVNPALSYARVTYERLTARFPGFLLKPRMKEYTVVIPRQKRKIVSRPKEFTPLLRLP